LKSAFIGLFKIVFLSFPEYKFWEYFSEKKMCFFIGKGQQSTGLIIK